MADADGDDDDDDDDDSHGSYTGLDCTGLSPPKPPSPCSRRFFFMIIMTVLIIIIIPITGSPTGGIGPPSGGQSDDGDLDSGNRVDSSYG